MSSCNYLLYVAPFRRYSIPNVQNRYIWLPLLRLTPCPPTVLGRIHGRVEGAIAPRPYGRRNFSKWYGSGWKTSPAGARIVDWSILVYATKLQCVICIFACRSFDARIKLQVWHLGLNDNGTDSLFTSKSLTYFSFISYDFRMWKVIITGRPKHWQCNFKYT